MLAGLPANRTGAASDRREDGTAEYGEPLPSDRVGRIWKKNSEQYFRVVKKRWRT